MLICKCVNFYFGPNSHTPSFPYPLSLKFTLEPCYNSKTADISKIEMRVEELEHEYHIVLI